MARLRWIFASFARPPAAPPAARILLLKQGMGGSSWSFWGGVLALVAGCVGGVGDDSLPDAAAVAGDGGAIVAADGYVAAPDAETPTADAAARSDAEVGADAGPGEGDAGAPAPPGYEHCSALADTGDAPTNRARLLECLEEAGAARLAPGTYPIDRRIEMPDGSELRGDTTWPRLLMVGNEQSVVVTHDDNEVAFLRIDANHHLTVAHDAIVRLVGDGSFVHDNHIQNATGVRGDDRVTGVRFWNPESRGNRVFRNQIHHNHYGVIFDLFPNGADNLLEDNSIYDNRCDSVTFRGYGRAHGNRVFHNGWDCLNGIPGGGFYTLNNDAGAELIDNHSYENCGMALDLDGSRRFVIRDNLFEKPGYTWGGTRPCGAGMTAHLIDMRDSVIEGNTFRNAGESTVRRDPNRVMSIDGSTAPSDLPSGASQAVAFMLTHRRGSSRLTVHNAITDNRFIANCRAPCVGLGYFVGRGTGYSASGAWSASTTNYFRENDPFGSNIGSKRCGGNWYAADATCAAGALEPSCNRDDPQHQGAGHDWARNDGCAHYR